MSLPGLVWLTTFATPWPARTILPCAESGQREHLSPSLNRQPGCAFLALRRCLSLDPVAFDPCSRTARPCARFSTGPRRLQLLDLELQGTCWPVVDARDCHPLDVLAACLEPG